MSTTKQSDAPKHLATFLGIVLLGALAMGSHRKSKVTVTHPEAGAAVATVDAAATEKADVPDPASDYTSLDDAKLDGAKAYGKTALIRVWRGNTEPKKVTLYQCGAKGMSWLNATYTEEQKALVKALPTTISLHGRCPRVLVKITGKERYGGMLKAELQQILDVEAAEEKPLPAGVDFVSMDDVNMTGKSAAGKVARIRVYRGNEDTKKFVAYECGRVGGIQFVNVHYTPDQKEAIKTLPTMPSGCLPIKIKLKSQDFTHTWTADLVEVDKDE